MKFPLTLALILVVQVMCAVFFVGQILSSIIGLRVTPIDWRVYEWIEIGASVGLLLGVGLGAYALRQSLTRTQRAEVRLAELSGAFMDIITRRFATWGLTPAERDVALFLLKGMTTQEIAGLRNTSEGTVKAQSNAIYRKAEVANRAQLVSLFIDDLMQGELKSFQADTE